MDRRRLIVLVVWTLAWSFGSVARSGPLTPPGTPAPTMKTLNEVEARIPIGPLTTPGDANAVFVISQPGSYYLTGNVQGAAGKSGIRIASSSVTLDLNGYELVGGGGTSVHGVTMGAYYLGIEISNGVVQGWGQSGIEARAETGVIRDIRVYQCGKWGIDLTGSLLARVENCTVYGSGSNTGVGGGIFAADHATVVNCTVYSVSGSGIQTYGLVRGCNVVGVSADVAAGQSGIGIQGWMVESSLARYCSGVGIRGERMVRGCVSTNNTGGAYVGVLVIDSN